MRISALAAVWVGLVVIGCGGGGSAKLDGSVISPQDDAEVEVDAVVVGPMDYAISVSPTSLTLPIASSETVDVSITRNNFDDVITLSAVNVPAGVNVTFDPPMLGAGVNASMATVAIDGGIAEGSATITIDATAGVRQKSATVSVTWQRITVTGKVQGGTSGVYVVMPGRTPITTTSGGMFTFPDVTPPYDLYTVSSAGFFEVFEYVYYYKGLTRPDPVVTYASNLFIAVTAYSAQLTGAISGHPGYANTWVAWGNNAGTAQTITANTSYSMLNATWPQADGTSKNGNLHALAWSTTAGQTTQLYYGATAASLDANVGETLNVTLAQPTTATLTGTLTVPSGFDPPEFKVFQNAGFTGRSICSATGTAVSTIIPVIAAGKSTFYAHATASGGASSTMSWPELDANTDVSFTLLDPPSLVAPANAATGVTTSTAFTFTAPSNRVHQFTATTSGTNKQVYTVYTTATTVQIPNVSEAPLPSGQSFSWSVQSYGPNAHVNDAAAATGLVYPGEGLPSGPRRTHIGSVGRTFTAQ